MNDLSICVDAHVSGLAEILLTEPDAHRGGAVLQYLELGAAKGDSPFGSAALNSLGEDSRLTSSLNRSRRDAEPPGHFFIRALESCKLFQFAQINTRCRSPSCHHTRPLSVLLRIPLLARFPGFSAPPPNRLMLGRGLRYRGDLPES